MSEHPRASSPSRSASSDRSSREGEPVHDVVVLGSGIGGLTLAAILARQGLDVLVVERGKHPRFAIGESLLPQSTMWMWLLGRRFDVPEIGHLAHLDSIREHVTTSCGLKRTIGFLYHREGEDQEAIESNLLIPPKLPLFGESHLFREDVDLYLLEAAKKHGATYRDETEVVEVETAVGAVRLETAAGETLRGRFLVDATGFRSPLATRDDLRRDPPELETRSRSIFTHFEGLTPWDDTVPDKDLPGLTQRWHDGTLHHVFDGGWFWIIPFDNYPGSSNPRASIGLTLDMEKYPLRGEEAEVEFHRVVESLPGVARHLRGVRPVRPWVSTGRLQYTSTRSTGDGYCLLSHAHGFIDALYSQGMINTFESVHAVASRLLAAFGDGDLSRERFADLDHLHDDQVMANDQMVASSYRAMGSYATWNAWLKLWLASKIYGDLWIFRSCLRYLEQGDPEVLAELDGGRRRAVVQAPFGEHLEELVASGADWMRRYRAGEVEAGEAAAAIHAELAAADWLPHGLFPWGDDEARHLDLQPEKLMGMVAWGRSGDSPAWLREGVFDFEPPFGKPEVSRAGAP